MDARIIESNELHDQLIKKNMGRNDPLRYNNQALICFAVLLGLREIELTEITNDLFITPNGELNELVVLPSTITWDSYERPIVLSNPVVINAFELHIKQQKELGINTHYHKSYMGMNPSSKVFYNEDFKSFKPQGRGEKPPKKGENETRKARSANMMNKYLDILIRNSGLWQSGVRRKSFLYTFVCHAYREKMSVNDIMIITGLSEESVESHLVRDYSAYSPISDWFEKRRSDKKKRLISYAKRRKYMLNLD